MEGLLSTGPIPSSYIYSLLNGDLSKLLLRDLNNWRRYVRNQTLLVQQQKQKEEYIIFLYLHYGKIYFFICIYIAAWCCTLVKCHI